jgi:hypothetical protein
MKDGRAGTKRGLIVARPVSKSSHTQEISCCHPREHRGRLRRRKVQSFSNIGDEAGPTLTAMPESDIENVNKGFGASHQSNSADPDESQAAEDGFAAEVAGLLNKRVLNGEVSDLIIIAARRASQELTQEAVGRSSRRDLQGPYRSRGAR